MLPPASAGIQANLSAAAKKKSAILAETLTPLKICYYSPAFIASAGSHFRPSNTYKFLLESILILFFN
jgi:hypothetical protein